jgi:hypothetical protein
MGIFEVSIWETWRKKVGGSCAEPRAMEGPRPRGVEEHTERERESALCSDVNNEMMGGGDW